MTDKCYIPYDPSDLNESGLRHWKLFETNEIFTEEMIGKNKAFVYELIFPPEEGEESMRYIGYKTISDDGKWEDYLGSSVAVNNWVKKNEKSRVQRVILSLHKNIDSARKEEKRLHDELNVYNDENYFNKKIRNVSNVEVGGNHYSLVMNECIYIGNSQIDKEYGYDEFVIGMNIPLGVILVTLNIINIKDHPDTGRITACSFRWKPGFWKYFYEEDKDYDYYYSTPIEELRLPETDSAGSNGSDDFCEEWNFYTDSNLPEKITSKYENEYYKLLIQYYNDPDTGTCAIRFSILEYQDTNKFLSRVINSMEVEIPGYRCIKNDSESDSEPQWFRIRSI